MKRLLLAAILLVLIAVAMGGCHRRDVVENDTGTYRMLRPETRDAKGLIDIELWSKDGVDPKRYVYRRVQFADGTTMFARMEN